MEALVREWAQRGFDDGFDRVEDFEIQRARERDLVLALESGDPRQVRRAHEQRICDRVIREYGTIELRGIQTSHRVLLDLDKVYVPLHLSWLDVIDADKGQFFSVRLQWRRFPVSEVLAKQQRVLIVGAPGSGKTTLVGYLAANLAADQGAAEVKLPGRRLPLVLPVRALSRPTMTATAIANHLDTDETTVEAALAEGRAVVLLDGVDEVPPSQRSELFSSLRNLVRKYSEVCVVVTSRPVGSPGEVERELPFLESYRLAELSEAEVGLFIDRWCLAAETSVRTDLGEARKTAEKAAGDLKRSIGKSRPVQRIAVNPLLASVLCTVHRFLGQRIPEHRVALYEKCTDALLYEWDRAKFPDGAAIGRLDAPAKRRLLMGIARRLHERHEAELSEREVVEEFALALPELGDSTTDPRELVAEIRDRSGLLVELRPGHFAFSHLTFQEYLTALDLVRTHGVARLVKLASDPWWHEVITLTAGVSGANATALVQALLTRDVDGVFLAARCLETAVDLSPGIRRDVAQQLSRLVPPASAVAANRLSQLGVVAAPVLAEALQSATQWQGTEVAYTISSLGQIDYEPAIPVLARFTTDTRPTPDHIGETVGEVATFYLTLQATTSPIAMRSLKRVLSEREFRRDFVAILLTETDIALSDYPERAPRILEIQTLIAATPREARREKPAPKLA